MIAQAQNALIAGAVTCTITGISAMLDSGYQLVFIDAFKMGLLLMFVVPPTILLIGWIKR